MKLRIIESNRPETQDDENRYFLENYRRCLEECGDLLDMTGAYSLFDVPKVLKETLEKINPTKS